MDSVSLWLHSLIVGGIKCFVILVIIFLVSLIRTSGWNCVDN